jgi:hypothetical protein
MSENIRKSDLEAKAFLDEGIDIDNRINSIEPIANESKVEPILIKVTPTSHHLKSLSNAIKDMDSGVGVEEIKLKYPDLSNGAENEGIFWRALNSRRLSNIIKEVRNLKKSGASESIFKIGSYRIPCDINARIEYERLLKLREEHKGKINKSTQVERNFSRNSIIRKAPCLISLTESDGVISVIPGLGPGHRKGKGGMGSSGGVEKGEKVKSDNSGFKINLMAEIDEILNEPIIPESGDLKEMEERVFSSFTRRNKVVHGKYKKQVRDYLRKGFLAVGRKCIRDYLVRENDVELFNKIKDITGPIYNI